jgi:phosphomannomutase
MTVSYRFIFDVDGTLTPSRGLIDDEFASFFTNFCDENYVYLITGSDYPKTVEQLGKTICEKVECVYNCSGNDVWKKGENILTNNWTLPETAHGWLSEMLSESKFYRKTGLHFEHRPGMVNFSIVGRNANLEERAMYKEWDEHKNERNTIARQFNKLFPDIEARPGGETGIDIAPKGSDKSQIVKDFDPVDDILQFFGDRMDVAGNDYPLKKVILDKDLGFCYNIKDYKETWKILKDEFSNPD